jgi:hypothetical protein
VSALWRAVIAQAAVDTADEEERGRIAGWLRSKDFLYVCELADINASYVYEEIYNLISIPSRALRLHYSHKLRRFLES